jgi:hypothetical protein
MNSSADSASNIPRRRCFDISRFNYLPPGLGRRAIQ